MMRRAYKEGWFQYIGESLDLYLWYQYEFFRLIKTLFVKTDVARQWYVTHILL